MKVVFSARAKTDLAEFVKFIAQDKPQAARKWAARIRESVLTLSDFPRLGRTVPEFGDSTIREILSGEAAKTLAADSRGWTRIKNESLLIKILNIAG